MHSYQLHPLSFRFGLYLKRPENYILPNDSHAQLKRKCHDAQGNLLNTNADTIASSIASKLSAQLLYCFEKNGVLYDKDQDDSVIPFINPELFTTLKAEGVIAGGMIPKVENALKALNDGANSVIIKNSGQLLEDKGTKISL